jgi:phenylalanine-4-hydroxylase
MSKYIAKKPDAKGKIHFTAEENATWQILIERQMAVIKNRACNEFIAGLKKLELPHQRIPQCQEISEVLKPITDWSVVPVATLIPLKEFFGLLANRQFPAASFIRLRQELDYLQEPDIFHEYFGHCPLLTDPAYADFVQWYGETALTTSREIQSLLGRLFWFTVEFGLLQSSHGLQIYGGGILSSYQETIFALESPLPKRIKLELHAPQEGDEADDNHIKNLSTKGIYAVLKTPYRYDIIQEKYFVINNISELYFLKSNDIVAMAKEIIHSQNQGQNNDFVIC